MTKIKATTRSKVERYQQAKESEAKAYKAKLDAIRSHRGAKANTRASLHAAVLALQAEGWTYRAMAEEIGISASRLHQIVQEGVT